MLFLGMYTWNQRTHVLDRLATALGLEITGAILSPLRAAQEKILSLWDHYGNLVNVREENNRLHQQVMDLEHQLLQHREDLAELRRLRQLVHFPLEDTRWRHLGARVLAGRMGPNGVLDSITINRGYSTGGRPGTPLVTHLGLVGRVLKASAHSAIAMLITDPGSRIAVYAQESRALGILVGQGTRKTLEVNFVQRATQVQPGEMLLTSGMDEKYPRGLPVARVLTVAPSDYTQFMAITAEPIADLHHLEEVLLLEPTGVRLPTSSALPPEEFVGPPAPGTTPPESP